jgi:hypothetical protein
MAPDRKTPAYGGSLATLGSRRYFFGLWVTGRAALFESRMKSLGLGAGILGPLRVFGVGFFFAIT